MRRSWLALGKLLILLPLAGSVVGLDPRQLSRTTEDGALSTRASATTPAETKAQTRPDSTRTGSIEPTSSDASTSESSRSASASATGTAERDSSSTAPASLEAGALPSTAINGAAATSTAAIPRTNPNALPLQPRVTPALAVGGVILIALGMAYALIGVKKRWLHIQLSAAFLTSLAVTVLIIYVMNPPVKDGIQGAFLVGIVITGLVFGTLSIIFPEITEGLGCLLGGFCLSMWLLVLKPGGLVTSASSKAIFISAFCVGIYALSFSHHTRPFGLIASTSFAGATAVVLGVDCFSRAGLKEFWLYIWALNVDVFPIDVETYPHTRGLRVELAAIIFVFVLGVISQFKMWRVVRDHRRKRAAERLERERDVGELEEAVGRKVEDDITRERREWEAVYGNGGRPDLRKGDSESEDDGKSVRKTGAPVIELRELGRFDFEGQEARDGSGSSTPAGGMPELGSRPEPGGSNAKDARRNSDEILDEETKSMLRRTSLLGSLLNPEASRRRSSPLPAASLDPAASNAVKSEAKKRSSAVVPGPAVVPLPFSVPDAPESSEEDEGSSISACAESTPGLLMIDPDHPRAASLKRLSGGYLQMPSSSEVALLRFDGDGDDDGASSVAATLDGQSDANSTPPTDFGVAPTIAVRKDHGDFLHAGADGSGAVPVDGKRPSLPNAPLSESLSDQIAVVLQFQGKDSQDAAAAVPLPASPGPALALADYFPGVGEGGPRQAGEAPITSKSGQLIDGASASSGPKDNGVSGATSLRLSKASLNEQVPSHLSKVFLCYRTNEWAKHLSVAEKPGLDALEPTQDAVFVLEASPESSNEPSTEPTQPRGKHAGATTAEGPYLALPGEDSPQGASTASTPLNASREALPPGAGPTQAQSSAANRHRAESLASLEGRPSSVRSLPISDTSATRGVRSSSNPIPRHSTNASATRLNGYRAVSQPSLSALHLGNTLMSQRESLMNNKYTPRGSAQLTPVMEIDAQLAPDDSISVSDMRVSGADDDGTGHERTGLIQQQLSQQRERFNLYQPKRHSDLDGRRREAMMHHWRQSLREHSINNRQPQQFDEARGSDMHLDRQHKLHNTRHKTAPNAEAEVLVDERMRRADMLELHRMAMKKMQAVANLHATSTASQ